MATKEDVAIESLEKRINALYEEVFNNESTDISKSKHPFEVVEESKSILKEIESRHTVVQQLWKKLPKLAEYLSMDFMNRIGVTDEVKTSLILASEGNLKVLSTQLKELQTLKSTINDKSLKEISDYSQKLEPLLQLHLDQKDEVEDVNERIQLLLSSYNSVITTLSKQFVLWDNLVTQCEIALDSDRDAIE